ncbi:MAG: radical SAM protein [bacterium]
MIAQGLERVEVILIKLTHYDDDGFPYCYARGVQPPNTLAVMENLVSQAMMHILPAEVSCRVRVFDESVWRDLRGHKALERSPKMWQENTMVIVCLVGVQSSQFPRACDLILRWQRRGAVCAIGGAHVSGTIATMLDGIKDKDRPDVPCPHIMPPELNALMASGVTVFEGEAEPHADGSSVLQQMLADMTHGRQLGLYRGGRPDLTSAGLPMVSPDRFGGYVTCTDTVGLGRGCPHKCSFCCVINFQGRKIRSREPNVVLAYVREVCEREGRILFFLYDDNFGCNPRREQLLGGLTALRNQGFNIRFMVQIDSRALGRTGFIEKLAAAGCGQIFVGIESLDDGNLAAAGKGHNRRADYEAIFVRCHRYGIIVHASMMVGMQHDTPESVSAEMDRLAELGADVMSLYICMPVPGSEDHVRLYCEGGLGEVDLNAMGGYIPTVDHPLMSREELVQLYRKSWLQFHRVRNMVAALKRFSNREDRWRLLRVYMWYRWAMKVEHTHAMNAGLYRVRPYFERRPISPKLSFALYLLQEAWRHMRYLGLFLAEFYVFQHVYLETEFAPKLAEQRGKVIDRVSGFRDWWRLTFGDIMTRAWLNNFWKNYGRNRWKLLVPWHWWKHLVAVPHAFSEIVYTIRVAALFRRLFKMANL